MRSEAARWSSATWSEFELDLAGGEDFLHLDPFTGLGISHVAIDLGTEPGGVTGDGHADEVAIDGSAGNDQFVVSSVGSTVRIAGLGPEVTIDHVDAGTDTLGFKGFGGDDPRLVGAAGRGRKTRMAGTSPAMT